MYRVFIHIMFDKLKKIFKGGRFSGKEKDISRDTPSLSNITTPHTAEKDEPESRHNLTKTGIRKIDANANLYELFQADREEKIYQKPEKTGNRKPDVKSLKNKHGIPILDQKKDYETIFLEGTVAASQDKTPPDSGKNADNPDDVEIDFSEMINISFKGKTTEDLLAEKTDDIPGGKSPLHFKQKLQFHLAPQAQLDLHGYTAATAERKAETFIRNARMHGTQTLLIIVGKGLHSDDGRAVLRDVAENLLIRLKQEKIIIAYDWDRTKKTKSGAVIVYL